MNRVVFSGILESDPNVHFGKHDCLAGVAVLKFGDHGRIPIYAIGKVAEELGQFRGRERVTVEGALTCAHATEAIAILVNHVSAHKSSDRNSATRIRTSMSRFL